MDKPVIEQTVLEQIQDKTPIERAAIKAEAHAKAFVPCKFTQDGVDFTIDSLGINGTMICVNATASINGKPLILDLPFIYHNPPVMIPDGTFHEEIDPLTKETLKLENYKEDVVEALKQIVVETVRVIALKKK